MKALLSVLQSNQFQVVPGLSCLPTALQGRPLRWSREVTGTTLHSGMCEAQCCVIQPHLVCVL